MIPICECIPLGRTYCPAVGMDFYKGFFLPGNQKKGVRPFKVLQNMQNHNPMRKQIFGKILDGDMPYTICPVFIVKISKSKLC